MPSESDIREQLEAEYGDAVEDVDYSDERGLAMCIIEEAITRDGAADLSDALDGYEVDGMIPAGGVTQVNVVVTEEDNGE